MADFDRTIPPGGEGKITLKLNLKGFQGSVKKSATVFSNDPRKSRTVLTLEGTVKALVELSPSSTVTFRGMSGQLPEQTITMTGTVQPFHIGKVETNLGDKITYQVATIEEGKQYTLKISNRMRQGNYGGFIKLHTDLAEKPMVVVRIIGYVEGAISVKPQTILVGKLVAQQSLRLGKVLVVSNQDKPFQITNLKFDDKLISLTPQPLPNNHGFSLEITPKLDTIPSGARQQTVVMFETDLTPGEQYEVQVHVLNSQEPAMSSTPDAKGAKPAVNAGSDEEDDEEEEDEEGEEGGEDEGDNPAVKKQ